MCPTTPSEQIHGWVLKIELSTAPSSLHDPQSKIKEEGLCPVEGPAVVLSAGRPHIQHVAFWSKSTCKAKLGVMKAVNKGPWHHRSRQEEQLFTRRKAPGGNLGNSFATQKTTLSHIFISNWWYISVTPPCPAILDRQPAINVTCNGCQLVLTKRKTTRTRPEVRSAGQCNATKTSQPNRVW